MTTAKYIKQLAGETVVYGLSATITRFIGFFLIPLYTRVFTPADYGLIAVISSFTSLISTFVALGLSSASARWYYDCTKEETEKRKQVISTWFWTQMSSSSMAAIIIIMFSASLAARLLDSPALAGLLILSGLAVPLTTFGRVSGIWLRVRRRAWLMMVYSVFTSLTTIGLTIVFVLVLRRGMFGLYWAQLLALLVVAAVTALILRGWIAPRFFSLPLLREMLAYALPLVPAAVASWVTPSANRFFLKAYASNAEIGLLSLAVSITTVIKLFTNAFQTAWGPFAFSILHERDSSQVYGKVLSIYSLLGCGLATALTLFAPLLLAILTTPEYADAASCVPWLAFSALAYGATYIAALGSGIAKKSVRVSTSILVGACVNIVLNLLLIPSLGKEGAAISTMTAYAIATAYLFVASQKLYPIPYRFRDPLVCLGFSWLLIGFNHYFLPTWGVMPFLIRAGMCLLFIPLAFWLGTVRPGHVRLLSMSIGRRIGLITN